MDNQHRKIKGYRELSESEIALMNEIKSKAQEVGELVAKLESAAFAQFEEEVPDVRWVQIAKADLQQGFMALTRSIAKPESF